MSIEDSNTEVSAAFAAGQEAQTAGNRIVVFGREEGQEAAVFLTVGNDGQVRHAKDVQDAMDVRLASPLRRTAARVVTDLDSFVAVVNRWKMTNQSTVWANTRNTRLTAVLDDYPSGPTGTAWQGHRITYAPPLSAELTKWKAHDGEGMAQDDFARWIDDNAPDIKAPKQVEGGTVYPTQVELLEMARNLSIYTRGTFERKIDPLTGGGSLVVKDEHESYTTKIHRVFPLALRVFEGGAYYSVEARLQFKITGPRVIFTYQLYRIDELIRVAFDEVCQRVADKTALPLFKGEP